jgi:hypothetical protein
MGAGTGNMRRETGGKLYHVVLFALFQLRLLPHDSRIRLRQLLLITYARAPKCHVARGTT